MNGRQRHPQIRGTTPGSLQRSPIIVWNFVQRTDGEKSLRDQDRDTQAQSLILEGKRSPFHQQMKDFTGIDRCRLARSLFYFTFMIFYVFGSKVLSRNSNLGRHHLFNTEKRCQIGRPRRLAHIVATYPQAQLLPRSSKGDRQWNVIVSLASATPHISDNPPTIINRLSPVSQLFVGWGRESSYAHKGRDQFGQVTTFSSRD